MLFTYWIYYLFISTSFYRPNLPYKKFLDIPISKYLNIKSTITLLASDFVLYLSDFWSFHVYFGGIPMYISFLPP